VEATLTTELTGNNGWIGSIRRRVPFVRFLVSVCSVCSVVVSGWVSRFSRTVPVRLKADTPW